MAFAALIVAGLAALAAGWQALEARRERAAGERRHKKQLEAERKRHEELLALERERYEADQAARQDEKRAHPSVGGSTVQATGDAYAIAVRVTNTGLAIMPFFAVRLVTPNGLGLPVSQAASRALRPQEEQTVVVSLPTELVPPDTPILHPVIAWDDASGRNHERRSAHRVRLDQASSSEST